MYKKETDTQVLRHAYLHLSFCAYAYIRYCWEMKGNVPYSVKLFNRVQRNALIWINQVFNTDDREFLEERLEQAYMDELPSIKRTEEHYQYFVDMMEWDLGRVRDGIEIFGILR